MKTAIYARVSTKEGQDPTVQTRELQEYIERRGWQLVSKYVDVGITGAKEKRPELDKLMADAHLRRFDAVIVWKFDRFARSVSHLLRALETFQALGIHFVSLSESVDTSTPAGKMVFTVLGAVAELERSLIVERVRAGLRNARAKGRRLGRPKTVVDVTRVATLRASGLGWKRIASALEVGVGTLHRVVWMVPRRGKGSLNPPAKGCSLAARFGQLDYGVWPIIRFALSKMEMLIGGGIIDPEHHVRGLLWVFKSQSANAAMSVYWIFGEDRPSEKARVSYWAAI